jgi:cell division protein FtsB
MPGRTRSAIPFSLRWNDFPTPHPKMDLALAPVLSYNSPSFMAGRPKFFNPRGVRGGGAARGGGPDIWSRLLPVTYVLLGLGVLSLGGVVYWPQFQRTQELQNRKAALQREIESEQARTLRLQDELYALRDDRFYVERMARDVLHHARPGETVFKFPPYGGDASPLRPREVTR